MWNMILNFKVSRPCIEIVYYFSYLEIMFPNNKYVEIKIILSIYDLIYDLQLSYVKTWYSGERLFPLFGEYWATYDCVKHHFEPFHCFQLKFTLDFLLLSYPSKIFPFETMASPLVWKRPLLPSWRIILSLAKSDKILNRTSEFISSTIN